MVGVLVDTVFTVDCCGVCVSDVVWDDPVLPCFGFWDPRPADRDRLMFPPALGMPRPWIVGAGGSLGVPFERAVWIRGCGLALAVSRWLDAEGVLAMAGSLALVAKLVWAPGLWKGSPVAVEPGDALLAMVEVLKVDGVRVGISTCSKRSLVLRIRRILHRHKLAYNYGRTMVASQFRSQPKRNCRLMNNRSPA